MFSFLASKWTHGVALAAVWMVTGCSVHINSSIKTNTDETIGHDLKTVNGSIKVASGSVVEGECKTVNGSVELGAKARADRLKTVNGSIRILSDATVVGDVETVNGKISAEAGSTVGGNVKTVNGGLELGQEVVVEGEVELVNGSLKFESARVKGNVTFRNGSVQFSGETVLERDLIVEGTGKKSRNDDPIEIRLADLTMIHGSILVEDPDREVWLYLTGDARVQGTMEGVTLVEE